MKKVASNYWWTLGKKEPNRWSKKVIWGAFKLALVLLRLVCKLIDFFSGIGPGD